MAWHSRKPEEEKQLLESLTKENRIGCLIEKKPDECHAMGQFVEMLKHDFSKSAAIYRSTCEDFNNGPSCMRFAQHCLSGRGVPADPQLAFQYNQKACQLGEGESCLMAAMACTAIDSRKLRVETNYPMALDYMKQGCALGNANSCYMAGGMYLTGVPGVIEKDTFLAYKHDVRACMLGNGFACANLSGVFASIGADQLWDNSPSSTTAVVNGMEWRGKQMLAHSVINQMIQQKSG